MILRTQLDTELRHRLPELTSGGRLEVRTRKRDRGFTVMREGDGYQVIEDGFQDAVFTFDEAADLQKAVKKIARREFPRSRYLFMHLKEDGAPDG